MLRLKKCALRAGEARPHFLRFFPGISFPGNVNRGTENKSGRDKLQGETVIKTSRFASVLTLAVLFLAGMALAQTDPGVQSGNRGTGAALSSVLANNPSGILAFFTDGQTRFQDVETVSNSANVGLGPRFNSNQCSSCHAQPAVGGTGPATNPQFLFTSNGVAPGNTMPSFITANGPTRGSPIPVLL